MEFLRNIEKIKDRISAIREERNSYLGEYRERVIAAITKEELEEKFVYPEIIKALKKKVATKLIISREVELSKIKKYIRLANKFKVPFKMVDGLSYKGDIGLVVAADDALANIPENPVPSTFLQRILDAGLDEVYYKALGKKISSKHYNIIAEKLPDLLEYYEELTFWDKILGIKCVISDKLDN